jgi:membrane protein insertase Oxa1/YidC/SpoIIIJ
MSSIFRFLLIICIVFVVPSTGSTDEMRISLLKSDLNRATYGGVASYLNSATAFRIYENRSIEPVTKATSSDSSTEYVLVSKDLFEINFKYTDLTKSRISIDDSWVIDAIRYAHLPVVLQYVCGIIFKISLGLSQFLNSNLLLILSLCFMIKFFSLPLTLMINKLDQSYTVKHAKVLNFKNNLNDELTSEQKHFALVDYLKQENISAFYSLAPLLGYTWQILILMSFFNAMPDVLISISRASDFLYLYQEDALLQIGDFGVNILPFLMLLQTLVMGYFYKPKYSSSMGVRSDQRKTYTLGVFFFILLYNFPSGLIIFWISMNFISLFEREFFRRWVNR